MLNDMDLSLLARLKDDAAYLLVLNGVQAEIDTIADSIYDAKTDEEERRLVASWRALRKTLMWLRSKPAEAAAEVERNKSPLPMVDDAPMYPHGPLWDRWVKQKMNRERSKSPFLVEPPPAVPYVPSSTVPYMPSRTDGTGAFWQIPQMPAPGVPTAPWGYYNNPSDKFVGNDPTTSSNVMAAPPGFTTT